MSDNKIHCNRNVYVKHGWTQEVGTEVGGNFCSHWQIYVKHLLIRMQQNFHLRGQLLKFFQP